MSTISSQAPSISLPAQVSSIQQYEFHPWANGNDENTQIEILFQCQVDISPPLSDACSRPAIFSQPSAKM
jgi:hypothetical protein